MSKFENTSCSQCGKEFGPGDSGYSHCSDHAPENTALYSCSSSVCAEEWSFPENMLFKMSSGNPYCIDCLGPFENPVPWKSPETIEIDRLKAQNAKLLEALQLSWELSTWAACINWRRRDKDNTGEWLDDLKEKIELTQEAISAARESHE